MQVLLLERGKLNSESQVTTLDGTPWLLPVAMTALTGCRCIIALTRNKLAAEKSYRLKGKPRDRVSELPLSFVLKLNSPSYPY